MLQLTLLLLGDALSHNATSSTSLHVHAPSTATAHHFHHAKNATSPGVVEREKRSTAESARLRAGGAADSELARALKLESARREQEAPALRSKSKPAVEPLPEAATLPAAAAAAAAASPSPPPATTSGRAGLYSALLTLVLLAVALLVPAKARLRLLTEGLGGMSAYAQQCCSFCVLVATMTVAMLLFKLCQARACCMPAVHGWCLQPPCIHHAHTMHTPCTHHAHTMHMPCTCHAHACA